MLLREWNAVNTTEKRKGGGNGKESFQVLIMEATDRLIGVFGSPWPSG
jgi:hypothetical protein